MKIKKGFYNKIRRLVKLLSEPGIEIKMDCCERENSKEIIEQLICELKCNKFTIQWEDKKQFTADCSEDGQEE